MIKLFIDYRLGGNPRYYLPEEPEYLMLLPEQIQKCVCFVAYRENEDSPYIKLGTAFFVSVPAIVEGQSFTYVVTAKHIIAKIKTKNLKQVFLRINTHEGFLWVETNIDDWKVHLDDYNLDIAVLTGTLNSNVFDFQTIPLRMAVSQQTMTDYSIGVGEEVFLIGLFSKHMGRKKNLPIIRTGTIALMPDPDEPIEVKILGVRCEIEAYLIEARSIGGLSGSPVFVNLGFIRPAGSKPPSGGNLFWLGLMHGHWDIEVHSDEDHGSEEDDAFGFPQETVNMGIAIVVPAYKIEEVINQSYFVDLRKQYNDKLKEKTTT